MNFKLVRMRFRQPLHLSRGKLNTYESSEHMLHSDTVQAALFVCALQLYDEATAVKFQDAVQVSSAFPFLDDEFWLPRPLNLQLDDDPDSRKELKKIKYLKKVHFEQVLHGEKPPVSELLEHGDIWKKIWKDDMTQRVLIDRIDAGSTPFFLEKLYPVERHNDRGLYVLIQNNGFDPVKLKSLFRLLGDNGIGLQRNLGNGTFDIQNLDFEDFSFALPNSASAWVNLSLYRPKEEDAKKIKDSKTSHYQLQKRGGWLSSPYDMAHMSLRKKSVLMFSEGSVFAISDAAPIGKIEDLDPRKDVRHPVFRDGRGIFLPMK